MAAREPKSLDAATLARALEEFLSHSRHAAVVEDRREIFDLRSARYSISGEHGKPLLHLWSEERNLVRRVLDCERHGSSLRLTVQRFGQSKPGKLEIILGGEGRSPEARKSARLAYEAVLQRVLEREYPNAHIEPLRSTMDLERSFSPVYARGLVGFGRGAFAVLGVNQLELQPAVDGALTFAILWLDHCRRQMSERGYVEGLKLFVPAGRSEVVRERMAHLDHRAAKFELYELDERERSVKQIDCRDRGNIATRLVQHTSEAAARGRFAVLIAAVMQAAGSNAGAVEIAVLSTAEISFRVRGLEFARARIPHDARSFSKKEELVFGLGAAEQVLDDSNRPMFRELLARILAGRHAGGERNSVLWRMHPERWLESLVKAHVGAIDSRFDEEGTPVYSQVPAFSASDRAMIDVLTCTREGRLAVLELKAEEDIHLPLQGIDYWARVDWHHQRGEFARFGYFPGVQLVDQPPLLLLVAPALHVHPATDTLLRFLAPEIDCTLAGLDEHWRDGLRIIFRKSRAAAANA
jgi:hypothetical protein